MTSTAKDTTFLDLRRRCGTQRFVADALGVSLSYVRVREAGRTAPAMLDVYALERLAQIVDEQYGGPVRRQRLRAAG